MNEDDNNGRNILRKIYQRQKIFEIGFFQWLQSWTPYFKQTITIFWKNFFLETIMDKNYETN